MISLALLVALTTAADTKPVVSVLYFENRSPNAELDVLKKGFADMVITDLVAWDGVTVVERGRLEAVLKELELQKSKGFDKTTTVKVGKLVGAEYAISGSLLLAQNKLRVDATITSVSKGEIVASATASDDADKVFDLEQKLVDQLTQAIDWKLKNKDARKKAKVPNFEALVAYSKAIDLSDQGKVDEAQKALAAVVSKAPTFLMARERKQELLEKLKEFESRKKDLVTGAALELGKRADEQLKKPYAQLSLEQKKEYLFWRVAKGRFLARMLKQHLSWRAETLRVVRPGQEAKALELIKGWAENQRRLIDEAAAVQKTDASASFDAQRAPYWELVRDSTLFVDDASPRFDRFLIVDALNDFIIQGRLSDGTAFDVAPPLGTLVPAETDQVLASLAQDVARFEAVYKRATDKKTAENDFESACFAQAEALRILRRDDDAAAAYQKLLDLIPTSDRASRAEDGIQEIIGTKHTHERSEREKFEKAVRECDDFYVNTEAGWRLKRKGLQGLDEIADEMEKACFGYPGLTYQWDRFYSALGGDAATHEDCARAKRFYLKSFTFGSVGPRSFNHLARNEPWCDYGLREATFPSKVRVSHVSEGTRGNKTAEALFHGLQELIGEELAARGVAVESGGTSNGGVLGLYVSLNPKDEKSQDFTLTGKLTLFSDGSPDVELSVPVKGKIDFDAFFAPAFKVLKGKSESGPRKPTLSMPLEQAVAFGNAMDLFEDRKWKEAQAAFEALQKKYPAFRLAGARARAAAAKAQKD